MVGQSGGSWVACRAEKSDFEMAGLTADQTVVSKAVHLAVWMVVWLVDYLVF